MNGIFIGRAALCHWPAEADFFAAAARVWHHAFESVRLPQEGFASAARVEIRIWGFARHEREAAREELQILLGGPAANFDGDTLSWSGSWLDSAEKWEEAARQNSQKLLQAAPFNGYFAMVRLQIAECYSVAPDGGPKSQKRGNTLVFWGRIDSAGSGKLVIAAAWPAKHGAPEELVFRAAVWPIEAEVMREIDRVRAGGAPELLPDAHLLFQTDSQSQAPGFITSLIVSPKANLPGLLARLTFWSLVAIGCVLFFAQNPGRNWWWLIGLWPALSSLRFLVAHHLGLVRSVYEGMKGNYQRLYTAPIAFPALEIGAEYEPSLRKFSAELEHAGGLPIGDVRLEPSPPGQMAVRMFQMPDGAVFALNLFTLSGPHLMAPAAAAFLVTTYFSDGSRLALGSHPAGFSKPSELPVVGRSWPNVPGVPEMLAYQREMLAWQHSQGKTVVFLSPAQNIQRMIADHEATRPVVAARGFYSWPEAFRFVFGLQRREYQTPKVDLARIRREEGALNS